jgi:signal transduction histidine kinase
MTDGPFLISTLPPSREQQSLARALAVLLGIAFLGALAFRGVQLHRYDAFVPVADTIVCLNDALTAALLYAQFSITRQRALLALASGFLFKALMMIPHALTFPGAFAPDGLLGAHLQTTPFFTIVQQLVFLFGAIAYTVYRDRQDDLPAADGSAAAPIGIAVGAVIAGVLYTTWFFTAGGTALPTIMADPTHTTIGFQRGGSRLFLLAIAASIIVFRRRSTSMVDLWVKIAMWSWVCEILLVIAVPMRFSLVFYVARTMGMLSSGFVLLVFLSESLILHRRLVATLVAREQEREGHRTSIDMVVGTLAHELRQPLTSILLNKQAGKKLLARGSAAAEEVPAVFDDIGASVVRANEVIDSVRTMFAPSAGDRGRIDANALVRDAVDLTRLELEAHHVALTLDLSPDLLDTMGHRGQLLEVMLNGLKNAIESLVGVSDGARALRILTTALETDGVAISIEDSGVGLDPRVSNRAFDPFFSTKPRGMGLGLSICQSIVSAHGGALSLASRHPRGAVLRIELPRVNGNSALAATALELQERFNGESALTATAL